MSRRNLRRLVQARGPLALLRLALLPLTLPFTNGWRGGQLLVRTMAAARRGERPVHFNAHAGLNNLFYWTSHLCLTRYGRRGRSPVTGLGDFELSRWFHYTMASLAAYRRAPTLTIVAGMVGFALAHLIWLGQVSGWVVAGVTVLLLVSTRFHTITFGLQNYNALGWPLFPPFIYGLVVGDWWLVGATLLAISFLSFTTTVIGGFFAVIAAVIEGSLWPLVAAAPAGLKLLSHLVPMLGQDALDGLENTSKLIGLTRREVRYRRKRLGLSLRTVYRAALYTQFAVVAWIVGGGPPSLFLASLFLALVNARAARFADEQTIWTLLMATGSATVLNDPSWLVVGSFWLTVSPLPVLSGYPSAGFPDVFDVVPNYRPFSVAHALADFDRLLEPVEAGQRVLMAFDDPQDRYEFLFDGYRVLLEIPHWLASRRGALFFPTFWSVYDLNYPGAPDFWGRDPESVGRNVSQWGADWVIVYRQGEERLDGRFLDAGFSLYGRFCFADYPELFEGYRPATDSDGALTWWLLAPPQPRAADEAGTGT